jgi:hypothetical protein
MEGVEMLTSLTKLEKLKAGTNLGITKDIVELEIEGWKLLLGLESFANSLFGRTV